MVNHGGTEIIDKMKVVTEQFFSLPLEEKMEWAQPPNDIEGYGQVFVLSEDRSMYLCRYGADRSNNIKN